MFSLFTFVVGLLVGWNFLKQPAIVAGWVAKIKARFVK